MVMLLSVSVSASSAEINRPGYFSRGIYVGLDLSTGLAVNGRVDTRRRNSCYGIDLAVGYRFMPQLAVAAGFGSMAYSNSTNTCNDTVYREIENTCIPVFLRFRSDFLDRRVSPYVQMDLGYSFMLKYARDDRGAVRYAGQPAASGHVEYIEYRDSYMQYGMDGVFGSLDLGLSWEVIGRFRMCFALSAGCHQAFHGTAFRMQDGSVLAFGHKFIRDERMVMTVGKPPLKESLELDARVKIAFVF